MTSAVTDAKVNRTAVKPDERLKFKIITKLSLRIKTYTFMLFSE